MEIYEIISMRKHIAWASTPEHAEQLAKQFSGKVVSHQIGREGRKTASPADIVEFLNSIQ